MNRKASLFLAATAVVATAAPSLAVDAVPPGRARTILAEDGTELYCAFDVETDESDQVTGLQITDCPTVLRTTEGDAQADAPVDLSALSVGASFVNHDTFGAAPTTITLKRVEPRIKSSGTTRLHRGMTELGLLFTFEAGDSRDSCTVLNVFGPQWERYYRLDGPDLECIEPQPGPSTRRWVVYEVPKRGQLRIVANGYDEQGHAILPTWLIEL